MLIKINNETISCENNREVITNTINEKLNNDNMVAIDFIVDGASVKEELSKYLSVRIKETKEIEVVTQSVENLILETIDLAYTYIQNGIPQIQKLASEFSTKPDTLTWQKLSDLMEGIDWLLASMEKINVLKSLESTISDYISWTKYAQITYNLTPAIKDLDSALRNKNNRKVCQILSRQIVPAFEMMAGQLYHLIPSQIKM
jgi:hypothetical protein